MKRLLAIWLVITALVGASSTASAWFQGGIFRGGCGGPCAPAFTFKGMSSNGDGTTSRTFSIDIGTASSDRLIVVALGIGNTTGPTSVTVAGVTLTQDVLRANAQTCAVYSGLVTGGSGTQNITIAGVGIFQEVAVAVFAAPGLSSSVVKQTSSNVGGTTSISVAAGDFLVAINATPGANSSYAASTETPTATRNVDTTGPRFTSAEWLPVISTNASFSVSGNQTPTCVAAATYR